MKDHPLLLFEWYCFRCLKRIDSPETPEQHIGRCNTTGFHWGPLTSDYAKGIRYH
jgi:hypothetical protein